MTVEMVDEKSEKKVEQKFSSFGPLWPKVYRAVDISSDKCLLPNDKLNFTPSITDGVDCDLEQELRFLGCELIQAASILLKLPQVAAATGQILYQRYFYSKSFVRFNFEHVAMACVHLASKIEEAPRRPRDVINVFHHLKQISRLRAKKERKKPSPMILDQNYIALKNHVIKAERRVLNVLGFCVHVKHPHKMITTYLRALNCEKNRELTQKAWNYMNDSLRTDIFVRYTPETMTCACIFLAARILQVPLPLEPLPWWELFNAKEEQILDISHVLITLYQRVKSCNWGRVERQIAGLREKMQQKSQINRTKQEPVAQEDTPKKVEKFSPSISRNVSPSVNKSELGPRRRDEVNGDEANARNKQKRRSHSSSSEGDKKRSSSPPLKTSRKDLPKHYANHKGTFHDRHDHRRKRPTRRSRSPKDTGPARKPIRRSRSNSRTRIKARKEREREVILALGKRADRRASSSPEFERKTNLTKSSRHR